ncbi:HAD-like domain-containing protein [Circinella umbellata]|nr:HAD-like domain-containing protein [Circinella umbellata]
MYNQYQNNRHYTPKTIIQTPRQVKEWTSFNENYIEKSLESSLSSIDKQTPSSSYLTLSQEPSKPLTDPMDKKKKLIILDLNGTLASRTTNRQSMYVRPYQDRFLDYIFKYFKVMVWSSAQPHSVTHMCQLFGEYEGDLLRMWDRRYFNLSRTNYNRKSQTIKDLEIVWKGLGDDNEFDATNTILIDDSPAKAIMQPYNSIHLCEFDHTSPHFLKYGEDELLHVIDYLERLRTQSNVCYFMSKEPFQSMDSTQNKDHIKEDDFKAYHYIFGQEGRKLHDFNPTKQQKNKKKEDQHEEEMRKIEQQLETTKL